MLNLNKAVFLLLAKWLWDKKSVRGALGRCLCWFGLIFPTGFTNHCFWNLTLVTVKTVTYRCQKKTWHSPNNWTVVPPHRHVTFTFHVMTKTNYPIVKFPQVLYTISVNTLTWVSKDNYKTKSNNASSYNPNRIFRDNSDIFTE